MDTERIEDGVFYTDYANGFCDYIWTDGDSVFYASRILHVDGTLHYTTVIQ